MPETHEFNVLSLLGTCEIVFSLQGGGGGGEDGVSQNREKGQVVLFSATRSHPVF